VVATSTFCTLTCEPLVVSEVEVVSIESHKLSLTTVLRSTVRGEPWLFLAALDNGHGRASTAVRDLG